VSFSQSDPGGTSPKVDFVEKLAKILVSVPKACYAAFAVASLCSLILTASLRLNHMPHYNYASAGDAPVAAAPIWPLQSAFDPEIAVPHKPVYPYSIIPGGAESSEELHKAVSMDPVVAEHYSDFNLATVRRVTLDAPKLMYVSYRVGNSVYWTKNKMLLPKGEAMLTDGKVMARTRCGNRVSIEPVRPNAPAEPAAVDFEAPVLGPEVSTPYLAAYSAPPMGLPAGPFSQTDGPPVGSSTPVAPFLPMPGGGGLRLSNVPVIPPPSGGGTPPPGPPPVGIPEPGTAELVVLCVSAIGWLAHRRKKA
jgi:hypothetical protein